MKLRNFHCGKIFKFASVSRKELLTDRVASHVQWGLFRYYCNENQKSCHSFWISEMNLFLKQCASNVYFVMSDMATVVNFHYTRNVFKFKNCIFLISCHWTKSFIYFWTYSAHQQNPTDLIWLGFSIKLFEFVQNISISLLSPILMVKYSALILYSLVNQEFFAHSLVLS